MQMLVKQNSGASTSGQKSEGATIQEQGTAGARICPDDEWMWAWACTVPLPGIAPSYWSMLVLIVALWVARLCIVVLC